MTPVPNTAAATRTTPSPKRPIAVVQEIRAASGAANVASPAGKPAGRAFLARPPHVTLGQLLRVTALLLVGAAWLIPLSLSNATGSATPPAAAARR